MYLERRRSSADLCVAGRPRHGARSRWSGSGRGDGGGGARARARIGGPSEVGFVVSVGTIAQAALDESYLIVDAAEVRVVEVRAPEGLEPDGGGHADDRGGRPESVGDGHAGGARVHVYLILRAGDRRSAIARYLSAKVARLGVAVGPRPDT